MFWYYTQALGSILKKIYEFLWSLCIPWIGVWAGVGGKTLTVKDNKVRKINVSSVKELRDKKKAVLDVKRAELCIVYSTDSTPKVTEVPLRIC